jgi:Ethylbenzene dehydrogenase
MIKRTSAAPTIYVAFLAILAMTFISCTGDTGPAGPPGPPGGNADVDFTKLNAVPVPTGPAIDGREDGLWSLAPTLTVRMGETFDVYDPSSINDCTGCHAYDSNVQVDVKAVYTTEMIYVLAMWNDPTASFTRGGSWEFVNDAWSRSENTVQSEDRIALFFPMGAIGGAPFDTGGCMSKCHAYYPTDSDPHVSSHGIVDDAWLSSGRGDMWHSKAARCGAVTSAYGSGLTVNSDTHEVTGGYLSMVGYADDKYVDEWQDDAANGEDGGRYGDAGTSSYSHNRISDKSRPKFMETSPVDYADAMILLQTEIDAGECVGDGTLGVSDADASTYWPSYQSVGACIPERILRQPDGSRGDIALGAVWNNGIWTVEFARALDTTHDDDIQFTLGREYLFNIATFENSRHGYEHRTSESYFMTFLE